MREIKFRVWTAGVMLQGVMLNLLKNSNGRYTELGQGYYLSGPKKGEHANFSMHSSEIMLGVGIKDKNGKEVYRGDIIAAYTFDHLIDKKQIGKIEYSNRRSGYIFVPEHLAAKNLYYPLLAIVSCEVIGNIYENPELLEHTNV